jgi:hypothetical protein
LDSKKFDKLKKIKKIKHAIGCLILLRPKKVPFFFIENLLLQRSVSPLIADRQLMTRVT